MGESNRIWLSWPVGSLRYLQHDLYLLENAANRCMTAELDLRRELDSFDCVSFAALLSLPLCRSMRISLSTYYLP